MGSGFNWIADLSPRAREALLARTSHRTYDDGTIIYQQGDVTTEVLQIVSGKIRTFIATEDGREVLLYICNEGDVVGDSSALDSNPYPVTIETRGETVLRTWSLHTVNQLRLEYPEMETALACQMVKRMRAFLVLIEELSTLPVQARIAGRMLALAEASGQQELLLSQCDLGLMSGATRQSVNETVSALKLGGLISSHYGRIAIRDRDGLRSYKTKHRDRQ